MNKSNKIHFWNVHGIMNTSGLLQSKREALLKLKTPVDDHDLLNLVINIFTEKVKQTAPDQTAPLDFFVFI